MSSPKEPPANQLFEGRDFLRPGRRSRLDQPTGTLLFKLFMDGSRPQDPFGVPTLYFHWSFVLFLDGGSCMDGPPPSRSGAQYPHDSAGAQR